jgi:hypothetical protein
VRFTNHGLLLRRGQLRCLVAHGTITLGRSDRTRLSGDETFNGNRVDSSCIADVLNGNQADSSCIAEAVNASDVQRKHCLANQQTYATRQRVYLARQHRQSHCRQSASEWVGRAHDPLYRPRPQ